MSSGTSSPRVASKTFDEALRLAGESPQLPRQGSLRLDRAWNYLRHREPSNHEAQEAEASGINIFDNTFTWPHERNTLYALSARSPSTRTPPTTSRILNRPPSLSTMVPGIGPSADLMLQARMFSYPDALQVLTPATALQQTHQPEYIKPYQRDGPGRMDGNCRRLIDMFAAATPAFPAVVTNSPLRQAMGW